MVVKLKTEDLWNKHPNFQQSARWLHVAGTYYAHCINLNGTNIYRLAEDSHQKTIKAVSEKTRFMHLVLCSHDMPAYENGTKLPAKNN